MEADKEKTTEQAKDLLSKVDAKKAMAVTDTFMGWVFKFGKVISALFMFVCILTIIGSLLYWMFTGSGSVKVPEFEAEVEETSSGDSDDKSKVSNAEFKQLRDEFGKKVDTIIEIASLDAKNDYNELINVLADINEDHRAIFLKGAISFLENAKDYAKDKKEKFNGDRALRKYGRKFASAVEDAKIEQEMKKEKKGKALSVCAFALLGMILFMIIPLLLQIEENTRK